MVNADSRGCGSETKQTQPHLSNPSLKGETL